jgi:hypothetical protein
VQGMSGSNIMFHHGLLIWQVTWVLSKFADICGMKLLFDSSYIADFVLISVVRRVFAVEGVTMVFVTYLWLACEATREEWIRAGPDLTALEPHGSLSKVKLKSPIDWSIGHWDSNIINSSLEPCVAWQSMEGLG